MPRGDVLTGTSAVIGDVDVSTSGVFTGNTRFDPGRCSDATVIDDVDGDTVYLSEPDGTLHGGKSY